MFSKGLVVFLSLVSSFALFSMELQLEKSSEALIGKSLVLIMMPSEIYLTILEFVLGVNPKLVASNDIFSALDDAKETIIENGRNFIGICKTFSSFKDVLSKISKLNLQSYLRLNWASNYRGKNVEELNVMLRNLFVQYQDNNEEDKLITAAQLICAGANASIPIEYYESSLEHAPIKRETYLLHFVVRIHKPQLMPILFLYNVNVNAKDNNGDTALIIAAKNEFYDLIELLIERNNIKLNETDSKGYTALDYSQAREFQSNINLLLNAKARENFDRVGELRKKDRPFSRFY